MLLYRTEAVVQRCSVKEGVLRNFAKFTGKHLCMTYVRVSFLIKLQAQVFSSGFCEISKNTDFTEHLQTTASVFY